MSVKNGTGMICIKEELEDTEFSCACDKCSESEFTRGMTTNLPMWDEFSGERIN